MRCERPLGKFVRRVGGRLLLTTHMHQARSCVSTCSRAALVDSSYVILLIIENGQQRVLVSMVIVRHRLEMTVSYHVVNPTEQSPAILPLARNHGIVLCFVSCAVFLAREPALCRLRASFVPAEQRFRVSFVVLSQIACACEPRARRTAWPCARPGSIGVFVPIVCDRVRVGRNASRHFGDGAVVY